MTKDQNKRESLSKVSIEDAVQKLCKEIGAKCEYFRRDTYTNKPAYKVDDQWFIFHLDSYRGVDAFYIKAFEGWGDKTTKDFEEKYSKFGIVLKDMGDVFIRKISNSEKSKEVSKMGLSEIVKRYLDKKADADSPMISRKAVSLLKKLLPYEKQIRKMIIEHWDDDIKLDVSSAFDIAPKYVPKEIVKIYEEAYNEVYKDQVLEDKVLKGFFSAALSGGEPSETASNSKESANDDESLIKKMIQKGKSALLEAAMDAAGYEDDLLFGGYSTYDLALYLVEAGYALNEHGRIVQSSTKKADTKPEEFKVGDLIEYTIDYGDEFPSYMIGEKIVGKITKIYDTGDIDIKWGDGQIDGPLPREILDNAVLKKRASKEESEEELEDEEFYVGITESEGKSPFIACISKEDGKWREKLLKGDALSFGSKTYMGYLKKSDILSWLYKDYEDVEFFDSEDEAQDWYRDNQIVEEENLKKMKPIDKLKKLAQDLFLLNKSKLSRWTPEGWEPGEDKPEESSEPKIDPMVDFPYNIMEKIEAYKKWEIRTQAEYEQFSSKLKDDLRNIVTDLPKNLTDSYKDETPQIDVLFFEYEDNPLAQEYLLSNKLLIDNAIRQVKKLSDRLTAWYERKTVEARDLGHENLLSQVTLPRYHYDEYELKILYSNSLPKMKKFIDSLNRKQKASNELRKLASEITDE